jgi:hypothetical protein
MTAFIDLVALLAAIVLVGGVVAWMVREIRGDGLGFRAAPRGTEEWSALGLPSRPYGT